MKIVHVLAQNLEIFENALEGTGCHINGTKKIDNMAKSLTQFNARDVMGLIVFKNPMTAKTIKLITYFDELFMFNSLPIILVSDQATALYNAGKIKVRYSPLFVVNSIDNTISDIDLRRIFATLSCVSGEMYNLGDIDIRGRENSADSGKGVESSRTTLLADEVLAAHAALGGITLNADKRYSRE